MYFSGWVDFIKTLYLDSFVDKDNEWKSVKFWEMYLRYLRIRSLIMMSI